VIVWRTSNKQERVALAAILNDYVCAKFPEYAQSHEGAISPGEVKVHDASYLCASVLKNNQRRRENAASCSSVADQVCDTVQKIECRLDVLIAANEPIETPQCGC
jgi:hypothetical protein